MVSGRVENRMPSTWPSRTNSAAGSSNDLTSSLFNPRKLPPKKAICTGFPDVFDRAVVTGNPVRREISDLPPPPYVDEQGTPDRLMEYLAQSDVVVICLPLTEETTGLFGPEQFAAMKEEKQALIMKAS